MNTPLTATDACAQAIETLQKQHAQELAARDEKIENLMGALAAIEELVNDVPEANSHGTLLERVTRILAEHKRLEILHARLFAYIEFRKASAKDQLVSMIENFGVGARKAVQALQANEAPFHSFLQATPFFVEATTKFAVYAELEKFKHD